MRLHCACDKARTEQTVKALDNVWIIGPVKRPQSKFPWLSKASKMQTNRIWTSETKSAEACVLTCPPVPALRHLLCSVQDDGWTTDWVPNSECSHSSKDRVGLKGQQWWQLPVMAPKLAHGPTKAFAHIFARLIGRTGEALVQGRTINL